MSITCYKCNSPAFHWHKSPSAPLPPSSGLSRKGNCPPKETFFATNKEQRPFLKTFFAVQSHLCWNHLTHADFVFTMVFHRVASKLSSRPRVITSWIDDSFSRWMFMVVTWYCWLSLLFGVHAYTSHTYTTMRHFISAHQRNTLLVDTLMPTVTRLF